MGMKAAIVSLAIVFASTATVNAQAGAHTVEQAFDLIRLGDAAGGTYKNDGQTLRRTVERMPDWTDERFPGAYIELEVTNSNCRISNGLLVRGSPEPPINTVETFDFLRFTALDINSARLLPGERVVSVDLTLRGEGNFYCFDRHSCASGMRTTTHILANSAAVAEQRLRSAMGQLRAACRGGS